MANSEFIIDSALRLSLSEKELTSITASLRKITKNFSEDLRNTLAQELVVMSAKGHYRTGQQALSAFIRQRKINTSKLSEVSKAGMMEAASQAQTAISRGVLNVSQVPSMFVQNAIKRQIILDRKKEERDLLRSQASELIGKTQKEGYKPTLDDARRVNEQIVRMTAFDKSKKYDQDRAVVIRGIKKDIGDLESVLNDILDKTGYTKQDLTERKTEDKQNWGKFTKLTAAIGGIIATMKRFVAPGIDRIENESLLKDVYPNINTAMSSFARVIGGDALKSSIMQADQYGQDFYTRLAMGKIQGSELTALHALSQASGVNLQELMLGANENANYIPQLVSALATAQGNMDKKWFRAYTQQIPGLENMPMLINSYNKNPQAFLDRFKTAQTNALSREQYTGIAREYGMITRGMTDTIESNTTGAVGGAIAGAIAGAIGGSTIPGIGTLVGGIGGLISGGIGGAYLGSKTEEVIKNYGNTDNSVHITQNIYGGNSKETADRAVDGISKAIQNETVGEAK